MIKMRKKRYDQVTARFYELIPELKPIADISICKCGCWQPILDSKHGRMREYHINPKFGGGLPGAANGMYGKHHSVISKNKISSAKIGKPGRPLTPEYTY